MVSCWDQFPTIPLKKTTDNRPRTTDKDSEAVLGFRWVGEHDGILVQRRTICEIRSSATDRTNGLRWAERPRAQPPDKIQNSLSRDRSKALAHGTPVIVSGDYAYGRRPPWKNVLDDPLAATVTPDEIDAMLREHLDALQTAVAARYAYQDSLSRRLIGIPF